MNALISTPADSEVQGVIRFLQAKNVRHCEIHQRVVAVYGENVSCTLYQIVTKNLQYRKIYARWVPRTG